MNKTKTLLSKIGMILVVLLVGVNTVKAQEKEKFIIKPDSTIYYFNTKSANTILLNESIKKIINLRIKKCARFIITFDANVPANARTSFDNAAQYWSSHIASNVPITIHVSSSYRPPTPGNNLVWAGQNLSPYGVLNGKIYRLALASKLLGYSVSPNAPFMTITYNSAINYYYGIDGNLAQGQVDFLSMAMHEIGHGLGVSGFTTTKPTPNPYVSNPNSIKNVNNVYEIYSQFVSVGQNNPLVNLPDASTEVYNALRSNNLYWSGANGIAGNNGVKPKLYAPSLFEPGSSYSHLDEQTYLAGNTNSLMTPVLNYNEVIHVAGPITLGILKDIGWDTNCWTIGEVDKPVIIKWTPDILRKN
jgi:hypothetical protein